MFKTKCQSLWIIQKVTLGLAVLVISATLKADPVDPALLAESPEAAGVVFALDTHSMLTSDQIIVDAIEGPVWRTSANAAFGKTLLQIPIILTPGNKPVEISNSYLKVAKGRFICYRLDDFGDAANLLEQAQADQREFNAGRRADAQAKDQARPRR
jgi:hypothetical protein